MKRQSTTLKPGYLVDLPPGATLNSRDFAALLGITMPAFKGRLKRGEIPRPDVMQAMNAIWRESECRQHLPVHARLSAKDGGRRSLWTVSTVRAWLDAQSDGS